MHTRVITEKGDAIPAFTIDDRIFLGEGLFETLRVESSKPRYATLHWQRLSNSAEFLGIPFDISVEDWEEYLISQIKKDNLYHGGIKVILSGGIAPRGLAEKGQISQLVVQTFNYTICTEPVRLISSLWLRDKANPVYQIKSVNYLEAIIARREALIRGVDDVLFYNSDENATETTCANLFIITNNRLITAPINDGVLAGIVRARIISLAIKNQITYEECSITQAMIKEADAVFITNSIHGIRSVSSLDDITFKMTHPILTQLITCLSED